MNLKEPCKKCEGVKRHKRDCPDRNLSAGGKASGLARVFEPSAFAERLKALPDEMFMSVVEAVTHEAAERRRRIEHEAVTRLRKLDTILPSKAPAAAPATVTPPPAALRTRERAQSPDQCPAICPDNVEIGCTQPKDHEGQHFNVHRKVSWPRR